MYKLIYIKKMYSELYRHRKGFVYFAWRVSIMKYTYHFLVQAAHMNLFLKRFDSFQSLCRRVAVLGERASNLLTNTKASRVPFCADVLATFLCPPNLLFSHSLAIACTLDIYFIMQIILSSGTNYISYNLFGIITKLSYYN